VNVPFIDLERVNARFDIASALDRVVRSGRYLFGPELESFETAFASYSGAKHCVGLANGLDALRLTLRAWLSLGRLAAGDGVVVPANSFIASALAATECGLSVRLADVEPGTFNMSAGTLAAAIDSRTRAVMPVHLFGQLAPMDAIRDLCASRKLLLLEDAAQAHGAGNASARAGALGDAAGFSFYPTKNLGALGDAGCVVTHDAELAARVRLLGNYGAAQKYRHDHAGINSRMDELQAAVLRLKLERLDEDNLRRRQIARRYSDEIRHPLVELPHAPRQPEAHVWHVYAVVTRQRDALARHLASRNIETNIHYPCVIHQQKAYAALSALTQAPVAERLQHQLLSLPISPVMSEAQVSHVIAAINLWDGS
jgi:dTDP-4-amino-4,6-dideoxygalactose transaminase